MSAASALTVCQGRLDQMEVELTLASQNVKVPISRSSTEELETPVTASVFEVLHSLEIFGPAT